MSARKRRRGSRSWSGRSGEKDRKPRRADRNQHQNPRHNHPAILSLFVRFTHQRLQRTFNKTLLSAGGVVNWRSLRAGDNKHAERKCNERQKSEEKMVKGLRKPASFHPPMVSWQERISCGLAKLELFQLSLYFN